MEELAVIEQAQGVGNRGGTGDSKGSDIGVDGKVTTAGMISAEQLSLSTVSQKEVKQEAA